jgi:NADH-quinone oxidoreductase subunit H
MTATLADLGIAAARVAFVMGFVLNLGGLMTWVERKQSAVMQDRVGANRASILGLRLIGLFHPLADAVKMLFKEDFIPARADRALFLAAPVVSVFFALSAFATIPFGPVVHLWGREVSLQAVTLNAGILFVFAMLSMGVYGVVLAGWASANNFALLGGQRAAALLISAEVAIGGSIMGVCLVYGSLDLQQIAQGQGTYWHGLPLWGIVTQPLGLILFLTAGIASTKRIPFDFPEGESEIIGYSLEYSGMKFGMFMMADFVETVVIAGMTTALFLGGWQVPWLFPDGFHLPGGLGFTLPRVVVVSLQILAFVLKVGVMCWFLMLVRWTLPRFRYDQAMRLGWLGLLPLAVLNLVVTAGVMLLVGGPAPR